MTVQTFELEKGRTFVAGLFWQTLNSPHNLKEEVRKRGQELDLDLYIIREATVPQVGLLSKSEGGAPGQMSCAAAVSKTLEIENGYTSALCAIELPDGRYLFVAIRDGTIMPDGDLIATEQEIEKKFIENQSLGDWPVKIAPVHWGISDAIERHFDTFLPKNSKGVVYHKWWSILDVAGDRRKIIKNALLFSIVIGACVMGYMLYLKKQQQQIQMQLEAQAVEEQRQKLAAYANIKIELPWTSIAHPADAMRACEASFRARYIFAAGWLMDSFTCDLNAATFAWKRDKTTLSDLQAALPEAVGDDMGDSASLTVPFALNPPDQEQLPAAGMAKRTFIESLQKIGDNFTVTETPVAIPVPPDAGPEFIPPAPDYKAFHWAIPVTRFRPNSVAEYLSIPTLRITKATATFKDGSISWGYEGDLYETNY